MTDHISSIGSCQTVEGGMRPMEVLRQRLPSAREVGRAAVGAAGALVGLGVMLGMGTYDGEAAGLKFEVSAHLSSDTRVRVHTTAGDISFGDISALPVRVDVVPEVTEEAVRRVALEPVKYVDQLRAGLNEEKGNLEKYYLGRSLLGLLGGGILGALAFEGAAALGTDSRRKKLLGTLGAGVSGALVGTLAAGGVGYATYDTSWQDRHELTGWWATFDQVPRTLEDLYKRDTLGRDKFAALFALQDALKTPVPEQDNTPTALKLLMISDMHLRNMYPSLESVIESEGVNLILNTGDESLFGTKTELTPDYIAAIRKVTAKTPMIFVRGNHDTKDTEAVLKTIPGVIVLDKQTVNAFGLTIAGLGDPRVFLDGGDSSGPAVNKAETEYANSTVSLIGANERVDIMMAHTPQAGAALGKALGERVFVIADGHLHEQNPTDTIEKDGHIFLDEGSTGMGGLFDQSGKTKMEFSILNVGPSCEMLNVVRYQLGDPTLPDQYNQSPYGMNTSVTTYNFKPQLATSGRVCSAGQSIGSPFDWGFRPPLINRLSRLPQ